MTIKEAELNFDCQCKKAIEDCKIKDEKKIKKMFLFGTVFFSIGLILLIIGLCLPKETYSFSKEEYLSFEAILLFTYASILMLISVILLLIAFIGNRNKDKVTVNFLPQIKNLYYNYLKCEDMEKDEKEFYKQKLEDIRYAELANAVRSAGDSTYTAIIFSSFIK